MPDPRHVVIVGSAPVTTADLLRICAGAGTLICADGGADAVLHAGLQPDLVLGDMDSTSVAGRAALESAGVRLIEHPVAKDKTDLELALDHALTLNPTRITITGALGGTRFDHGLGNVLLLALPTLRDLDVRIVDATTELLAVWEYRQFTGQPGDYVSLLPLTPRVDGVETEGLRYPLRHETLTQGHTRGVSNDLVGVTASVKVEAGCLLLVHERHG